MSKIDPRIERIAVMQIIQLFVVCVISAHGIFHNDMVSSLFDCLSNCSDDICEEVCDPFLGDSSFSQVDQDTQADVSLHCAGQDIITIKFNPGIYLIEQSESERDWKFMKVAKGSFATYSNLTSGTAYRYNLYNLTREGISRPKTSDWFSTFEAKYVPLPVKNITSIELDAEEENEWQLRAKIAFQPAEDRSCNYQIFAWNKPHRLQYFHWKMMEFEFKIGNLEFQQENNISISAINSFEGGKESQWISRQFETPSCLQFYNNATMCTPEGIIELQVEHTHRQGELYDLKISWNCTYKPDNYTIQIDLHGNEVDVYYSIVPGNITEVYIRSIKLGPRYVVRIVADTLEGSSLPKTVVNTIVNEHAKTNKILDLLGLVKETKIVEEQVEHRLTIPYDTYNNNSSRETIIEMTNSSREIIIGITLSVTVVIFIATICLHYYKRKSKNLSMECARFESQSIEITKKMLPQDYDSNNPLASTQTHDKFELCPKLLKLKGVLGSGAYGVVRLGQLCDKFDNATDVAVKMLKDNPSTEDLQDFHKEILIMKFVSQHLNVVSLIGCCTLHNKPVLVVEYCSKGDLQTYLRTIWKNMVSIAYDRRVRLQTDADSFSLYGVKCLSNKPGGKERIYENIQMIANRLYDIQQDISQYTEIVTANDLLSFARQIATGMVKVVLIIDRFGQLEFLSSNRIVHRDLAARNILLCENRIVKISDFGLSRDVYQENLYKKKGNGKLPLKWMAIEALTHQIYTTHSDVWSFGILLWEIATMGATPYPEISTTAILKLLKSGYRMERPPNCSTELYNIMFSCWSVRPQSRPTFSQLKESLDKLLSDNSDNKYLNMNEMLCEAQEQYQNVSEKLE